MSQKLGPFDVTASAAEVSAFRRATGLVGEDAALPLTYPIRWLVTPEIRAALLSLVPEPDLVLVHEGQAFDYEQPLHVGARYTLSLEARREASPDRLLVAGTIADADDALCATVETTLRLFSTQAAAA